MKLVSFNVNSVRLRLHQLQQLIEQHAPDIIGLQETKAPDEKFPLDEIHALGYRACFFGQPTHYGVAILSKQEPISVMRGFDWDAPDAQRRLIVADYAWGARTVRVINGYFPQGENRKHPVKFPAKERFYADLSRYLAADCSADQPLVLMGDFNVAPEDTDIGIGEENARRWLRAGSTAFLPEERAWYQRLMDWDLHDSYRVCHPDSTDYYSWFDYRSRGFDRDPKRGLRIDHILVNRPLLAAVKDAGIEYGVRAMTRPSDHCPVWVALDAARCV